MAEFDLAKKYVKEHFETASLSRKLRLKSITGMCIWCRYEGVVAKTAFCSAECCEDYFKYQREMSQRIKR